MNTHHLPATRRAIVNADDFGLSPGVNRAIMETHERGIVTSASLMVRQSAAADAVAQARPHPRLDIGLHLDLGEWRHQDGEWVPLYEVVRLDDASAVSAEVSRQLEAFRTLTGHNPTHLDSHQHVHLRDEVRSIVEPFALDLGVPLRHFTAGVTYCGDFYGQDSDGVLIPGAVSAESLIRILRGLPEGTTTEIACHPGGPADESYGGTMYLEEREEEAKVLCDPRVRSACDVAGIELCSFADLIPAGGDRAPTWFNRSRQSL